MTKLYEELESYNKGDAIYYFIDSNDNAVVTGCGSSIEDLLIPEVIGDKIVVRIGRDAFKDCKNLKTVYIPASVEWIYDGEDDERDCQDCFEIFIGCSSLEEITVAKDNPCYFSKDGVLFFKGYKNNDIDSDFYENVSLIKYPPAKKGSHYTLPHFVDFIEDYAFCDCVNLESVLIRESSSYINTGDCVFEGCENLKCILLPTNFYGIMDGMFYGCKNLEYIELPDSVYIGDNAFAECEKLSQVVFRGCADEIESYAFHNCRSLKSITLPQKVSKIWYNAFDNSDEFIIRGYYGTIAEEYAIENCIKFEPIENGTDIDEELEHELDILTANNVKWDLTYDEVRKTIDKLGLVLTDTDDEYFCSCSNAQVYECWHKSSKKDEPCLIYVEYDRDGEDITGEPTERGLVHHLDINRNEMINKGFRISLYGTALW